MLPTPRLLVLLLAGALLLVLGLRSEALLNLAVVYDCGVILLAVLDVVLQVKPGEITIKRVIPERLFLGIDNEIAIEVINRGRWPVRLLIRDNYPFQFSSVTEKIPVRLGAGAGKRVVYYLRPGERGLYRFGDLDLRVFSFLQLMARQVRVGAGSEVKVYPNVTQIRRYQILTRTRHLMEMGFKPLRRFGKGREFESLREYLPDDDYRDINWKATARHARPITQVYEVERSQDVMIMIDAGRLMAAEVAGMSKLDWAISAALMLSYVITSHDDRVGLLVFGQGVEAFLPPRKGKSQLNRLVEALYAVEPTLSDPNFPEAFSALHLRVKKRSLVVLFTDILDEASSRTLLEYLLVIRPRHLPLCITMNDPVMIGMAGQTPGRTADVYNKAMALDLLDERGRVLRHISSRGALVLDQPCHEVTTAAINKYLEVKARSLL